MCTVAQKSKSNSSPVCVHVVCLVSLSTVVIRVAKLNKSNREMLWNMVLWYTMSLCFLFLLMKLKKQHKILSHLKGITLTTIYVLTAFVRRKWTPLSLLHLLVLVQCAGTEINSINGDIKCLSTALVMVLGPCLRGRHHIKIQHRLAFMIKSKTKVSASDSHLNQCQWESLMLSFYRYCP